MGTIHGYELYMLRRMVLYNNKMEFNCRSFCVCGPLWPFHYAMFTARYVATKLIKSWCDKTGCCPNRHFEGNRLRSGLRTIGIFESSCCSKFYMFNLHFVAFCFAVNPTFVANGTSCCSKKVVHREIGAAKRAHNVWKLCSNPPLILFVTFVGLPCPTKCFVNP